MKDPAPRCKWILSFFLLTTHASFYSQPIFAQQLQTADSLLQQQMILYAQAYPEGQLFVHTDKTTYTNNETIWFCAYLLQSESVDMSMHQFVSAILVKEHTRKIAVQQKYKMDKGIASGSMVLPDTMPPGDYCLIVYTNVLNSTDNPVARFVQPLTIKSISQRSFYTNLQLLDTLPDQDGMVHARLTWGIKASFSPPNIKPIIEYKVGKFESKPKKVDGNSYIIAVNQQQLTIANPLLTASVRFEHEIQYLSMQLPGSAPDSCYLRFFPEGGYLVDGLESVIGWEARSSNNIPLQITAVIYNNGQAIDTIKTSRQGMGRFRLMPDRNCVYVVKVLNLPYANDQVWRLPEVLEQGVVLEVKEATVNDSLRIHFYSHEEQSLRVIIHNYRTLFLSFGINVPAEGIRVVVPMEVVPKGISTITVLDKNNKPIAERLFFAWYEKRQQEQISTDKSIYEKREKATVTVRLKDLSGNPLKGLVSIAVVQGNRIEYNKVQDIDTYYYLTSVLEQLQKPATGRILDDKDHLNYLLLTKGWRRFTWQRIQQAKANDKQQLHTPVITAQVTLNGRVPKRSLKVTLMRDGQMDIDSTNIEGKLMLNPTKLEVQEGQQVHVFISEKNAPVYSIEENDSFLLVNKRVAASELVHFAGNKRMQANSREQEIEGMQKAQILQQVVVTANNDHKIYGANGSNACGDYVCQSNILNCKNHFGSWNNRRPVKGNSYIQILGAPQDVTYAGCSIEENKMRLNGIYFAREFYGVNIDTSLIAEPQFLSTLHWDPASPLNRHGERTISFHTGDITGRFRIIVQGISNKDLISAETYFSVK